MGTVLLVSMGTVLSDTIETWCHREPSPLDTEPSPLTPLKSGIFYDRNSPGDAFPNLGMNPPTCQLHDFFYYAVRFPLFNQ